MPGETGATVVTNSCAFYTLRTRLRVHWAPGIPHALCFQGGGIMHNSGASRREIAEMHLDVVARSDLPVVAQRAKAEATKQSIRRHSGARSEPGISGVRCLASPRNDASSFFVSAIPFATGKLIDLAGEIGASRNCIFSRNKARDGRVS
jgi:hypothetical protein